MPDGDGVPDVGDRRRAATAAARGSRGRARCARPRRRLLEGLDGRAAGAPERDRRRRPCRARPAAGRAARRVRRARRRPAAGRAAVRRAPRARRRSRTTTRCCATTAWPHTPGPRAARRRPADLQAAAHVAGRARRAAGRASTPRPRGRTRRASVGTIVGADPRTHARRAGQDAAAQAQGHELARRLARRRPRGGAARSPRPSGRPG